MNSKRSLFTLLLASFSLAAQAQSDLSVVQAPDIRSGHEVKVTAAGKKGVVVIFLSAHCPCSNSHVQELAALQSEYPEFAFVGVHANADESRSETLAYFQKTHLSFPVVRDVGQKLADQYRAFKTPHAFVVLNDGRIVYRGGVSSSHSFQSAEHKFLREALEDIRQNRMIKIPEGRTLGCAIARGGGDAW